MLPRLDKSVFLTNVARCFLQPRSAASSHHFCLRWRPAVYHFCPLFTSQCLDNKLCLSRRSHWPPHKMKEPSRFFSLCLRGHSVTQILLSSLLFSGITSVRSGGTHTFHWSVWGWRRESVSINAWTCTLWEPDHNQSKALIWLMHPESLIKFLFKFSGKEQSWYQLEGKIKRQFWGSRLSLLEQFFPAECPWKFISIKRMYIPLH